MLYAGGILFMLIAVCSRLGVSVCVLIVCGCGGVTGCGCGGVMGWCSCCLFCTGVLVCELFFGGERVEPERVFCTSGTRSGMVWIILNACEAEGASVVL